MKRIIMEDFKLNALKNGSKKTLTRAEMKSIVGGDDCGNTPCQWDSDCGGTWCIFGHCSTWGGSNSCVDGNNGGCPIGKICIHSPDGTMCI